MTARSELAAALRRVVDDYGPHATADPVALRCALRARHSELPAADVALLVAVADAGVVDELRAVGHRGAPDPEAAVGKVLARHDRDVEDVRRALAAFAAVLGVPWAAGGDGTRSAPPREPGASSALPTGPVPDPGAGAAASIDSTVDRPSAGSTGARARSDRTVDLPVDAPAADDAGGRTQPNPGVDLAVGAPPRAGVPAVVVPRRITWDGTARRVVQQAAAAPGGRRRGLLIGLTVLLVAVLTVVAAAVALLGGARSEQQVRSPDRFAAHQVALRYRALGANLLDGALRCADLGTDAGRSERVGCDFGSWSIELISYDSVDELRAARATALAAAPGSARSAQATGSGSAFVMDQTMTAASRVYWDAESPRPVSALATTSELSMAELVDVYDDRRFTGIERPDQPGAAFASPALWRFASGLVTAAGGSCRPRTLADNDVGISEQVDCEFPDGVSATFGIVPDADDFAGSRAAQVSPSSTVPGSQQVGRWGEDAVVVDYVLADEGVPYLYYDRRDLLAFGLVRSDVLTQDQLRQLWSENHG